MSFLTPTEVGEDEVIPAENNVVTTYEVPEQRGPLRRFDKEMRCTSRRCGSPTFFKVRGMPLCMMHSLMELNRMLIERDIMEHFEKGQHVWCSPNGTHDVLGHVVKLAHQNEAGETKYGIWAGGAVHDLAYREPADRDANGAGGTFWTL
jgi:hypothetical protein